MKITEGPAAHFAEWVRVERARNGWSLAQLAADMTAQGCRMDGSAVSRIESGQRQVSVAEAYAFSRLIGRSLSAVVRPRAMATNREAKRLLQWHAQAEQEIRRLRADQARVEQHIVDLVDAGEVADVLAGMQVAGLEPETAEDLIARFQAQDSRRVPTPAQFMQMTEEDED